MTTYAVVARARLPNALISEGSAASDTAVYIHRNDLCVRSRPVCAAGSLPAAALSVVACGGHANKSRWRVDEAN